MQQQGLGDVIIERDFEYRSEYGESIPVKLLVGRPRLEGQTSGGNQMWNCPRQIIGIGDEKVRPGFGADSLQALIGTLKMADAELKAFAKRQRKTITWLGSENLMGVKLS